MRVPFLTMREMIRNTLLASVCLMIRFSLKDFRKKSFSKKGFPLRQFSLGQFSLEHLSVKELLKEVFKLHYKLRSKERCGFLVF